MKESQLLREKMKGNVSEKDKVRSRKDTRMPQPNLETVVCSRNAPHSVEAVRKMKESQLLRDKMKGNVSEKDKVRSRKDTRMPQPNLETVVCSRNAPHSVEAVRKMKESQLLREKMKGNVNEKHKVRSRKDTRMPQPNLETVVCSRSPGRHNCREHSSTPKPTTLQIGQLSRNVTREHIFEIFEAFGNVKNVEFPMDKLHPGCGTGSAYVEYATLAEAQSAMKHMVGGQIDGQEITAALVLMPPKPRPSLPRPSPPRRPVHCISFIHLHHHNIGEVCLIGDLIAPDLVVEHLFIKGGTVIQAPVIHTDFACEEPLGLHTD
ncbi:RNA-binding protein with serine-rich domain 1-like [Schistocerca serialis cubense]|uniref:RNA-binding protein with serine-rich domain 1-like n=1 Tax=Schistocerca serialis cubense TaxID=2023355 RepID=UPI00214E2F95|nr:RNA-binding protein with serine-rich domain 1-like [Schistocerca serialis cubense]